MRSLAPLLLLAPLALTSCDGLELTPEEAIQAHELELQYDEAKARATQWEEAADEARMHAAGALERGAEQDYHIALQAFENAVEQQQEATATMVAYREAAGTVYEAAARRQTGWIGGLLNFLPPGPWKLAVPFLGQIGVIALAPRARKRALESLVHLGKGNLAATAQGLWKAVGGMHTSPESAAAGEGAMAAAKAGELLAKAGAIQPQSPDIPPPPAT